MREHTIDVVGQDLMTSDKVTIRINALVTYKVIDTRQAVSAAEDPNQALYRATQMALRGIVSQHELDEFLANKEQIADESLKILRARAAELGLTVVDLGVRDIILPGDMRDLMNRVIEAKKAAEANLIARREETAAMRSQANTAKLLDAHPTLMRLRELEVLEKVASSSNLKVVLGDKDGLSDRLTRLV
jgi:regulator of protease activity HflC (stomatin/prohibitin superfamily)